LRPTLWRQGGQHVGHAEGVLVFEPAAVPKAGRAAGGGARPWGGRLGPGATGHGAISAGDVSRKGQTRVALR
jgi:hypothetical protein